MADLPDTYDLIVVGTGMPECIIAAAAARVGKSVLHLDRNQYYGGLWASFNFEFLLQWMNKQQEASTEPIQRLLEANWLEQLNDDEHLVLCPKHVAIASNVLQKSYLCENNGPEMEQSTSAAAQQDNIETEQQPAVADQIESSSNVSLENANEQEQVHEDQEDDVAQVSSSDRVADGEEGSSADSCSEQTVPTIEITAPAQRIEPIRRWSMDDLLQNRHKFNIDLSPKLLFSRGSLVELLISSNTSRYADFQSVNRILTHMNGHLEQVPCSRADVFNTKNVSVAEKRMLMKLSNFCLEYQKHPEEYRGYEGCPFIDFLRSRKITPNIEHYILHAIAMVDETCLTLQGLQATQKFMESLGRFGNSPFLWTCYGSAELPQCFCRLCAVFGGIYYLGRDADAIVLDSNNRCAGIISQGKKLKCPALVLEYSYAPEQYLPQQQPSLISRAIYITDCSILPAERQQNTLLRLPPVAGVRSAITVLEFGSLSFICPRDLYLVHMMCLANADTAAEDFQSAEEELFLAPGEDREEILQVEGRKPKVLWSLHFRHNDVKSLDLNSRLPSGIFLTSTPGIELDYEHAVKEARKIFEQLYPGEEFLPRAPDPEDIVMEEHSNPGNEAENNLNPLDDSDLEDKVVVEGITEEQCDIVGDSKVQSLESSHTECVEKGVEATEVNVDIS